MKVITVTLTLQVSDEASVEEVVDDITVDLYGRIEDIINISGEVEREVEVYSEKDE